MVKLTVDGQEIEAPAGANVLQACELAGREIPRFCYHERLSVAGNCRMCLVEVKPGPPKPMASCALPIAEGMQVFTDTEMVRNARRGVMEFLLINHPLDCPICDQGGECDLQDQSLGYGRDHSRYAESKRAVKDKNLGPLVKTVMTRCIQCTRCIRFATEIAGTSELGATARGENMEIGTYVEKALTSELSGNLIDICPVGALTSKPYAFVARPWELKKTDGIDVFDAVGTNIRIDTRGAEVLRVLPRLNEDVNEEWMADKGRFAIDGLKRRRLDRPWLRENGKLRPATWTEAFDAIAGKLRGLAGERIGAIFGDQCDAESMFALRELMTALGSRNLDCRQDGALPRLGRREFYLFNSSIAGIEDADAILLIGTNPRHEAPVLNARIRKTWISKGLPIAGIGTPAELTYPVAWLGAGLNLLLPLMDGSHEYAGVLRDAKRPMIIVGQAALRDARVPPGAWDLADKVGALLPDWHGFNVLHSAAARVAALDLGLVPGQGAKGIGGMLGGGVDLLWLLAADEFDVAGIGADTFVVYQGHHGDRGAARADVILPGAAYTEKSGTYVNTEGRVQRSAAALFPPGEAREDWTILRAFSDVAGHRLPFDTLAHLRERMVAANRVFELVDALPRFGASNKTGPVPPNNGYGQLPAAALKPLVANYYQTDPISRASETMARCTETYAAPVLRAAE
jgi:NADH-quinone oxidoreductase subunit G